MARRTETYAVRLAVEGGGQLKAELVSVGQSGEQSSKRIETAGDRASGGLKGLGRQAELLRTGIRTPGGALAGVATAGGLAALVDRSISAADASARPPKIGVGVEALQELRFAAKAPGVDRLRRGALRQLPLIFDAGFGLRSLGRFLRESARISGDIFLTHTHLDHIIGFPFFGQHTTGRDQGTPMTLRAHKMVAHASQ